MTLVRIGGIPVRLHVTFVVLVGGWVLLTLARGGLAAALDAAGALAVLFGSVLAHELGHAWIAHRHGIRTRSITLLPIGGSAQLEARRVSPGVDLRISLAGPLTNVAIAVVALGVGVPLRSTWLGTVGGVNLVLGVLNLVPAFPMDGGRVLRAALVPWRGLDAANRVTLAVGSVFAVAFAALGVLAGEPGLVVLALFMGLLQWRERRVQEILRRHPEWA